MSSATLFLNLDYPVYHQCKLTKNNKTKINVWNLDELLDIHPRRKGIFHSKSYVISYPLGSL